MGSEMCIRDSFCRGCGYCVPTCPAHIEINNCARMSLLLRRSPSELQLTEVVQAKMKMIEDCINCGVCVKACREGALTATEDGIAIDRDKCNNCGRCVKSCPTDAWKGESGYILSFGGLFGNKIYKGESLLPIIRDKDTLFRVADAAITFFEENANPGERFRLTLQRVGEEEFRKKIKEAYDGRD